MIFLSIGFEFIREFEWKDSLWQRMVISILASFKKWVVPPQSLASNRVNVAPAASPTWKYTVSLIAKPLGATTCLEYRVKAREDFLSLTTWQFGSWIFIQLWIRKPDFVFVVSLLYFTNCYVFGAKVSWNKLNVPSWLEIYTIP